MTAGTASTPHREDITANSSRASVPDVLFRLCNWLMSRAPTEIRTSPTSLLTRRLRHYPARKPPATPGTSRSCSRADRAEDAPGSTGTGRPADIALKRLIAVDSWSTTTQSSRRRAAPRRVTESSSPTGCDQPPGTDRWRVAAQRSLLNCAIGNFANRARRAYQSKPQTGPNEAAGPASMRRTAPSGSIDVLGFPGRRSLPRIKRLIQTWAGCRRFGVLLRGASNRYPGDADEAARRPHHQLLHRHSLTPCYYRRRLSRVNRRFPALHCDDVVFPLNHSCVRHPAVTCDRRPGARIEYSAPITNIELSAGTAL